MAAGGIVNDARLWTQEEASRQIARVLHVMADYYAGVDETLSEEEWTARKQRLHDDMILLGPESNKFARMLYMDAVRFAPTCFPLTESEPTS